MANSEIQQQNTLPTVNSIPENDFDKLQENYPTYTDKIDFLNNEKFKTIKEPLAATMYGLNFANISNSFKLTTLITTAALVVSMFFANPSFAQQTYKKPTSQKPTTSKQVSTRKNTAKTYAKAKDTTNYEAVKKIKIWRVDEIYGKEKTILIVQKCLLEEINKLRAEKKLQPLVMDTSLNKAAQLYADEMVVNKRFDHTGKGGTTPESRGMAQGYPNDKIGENILYSGGSIEHAIQNRKKSTMHFENIMDPRFSRFGAGYCNFNWVTMFGIQ